MLRRSIFIRIAPLAVVGLVALASPATSADSILEELKGWSPPPSGLITTEEAAKEIAIAVWKTVSRRDLGVQPDENYLRKAITAKLDGNHWILRIVPPSPGSGGITIVLGKIDGRVEGIFLNQ